MYLNKFFSIALSFILLSSSSGAMTPEEDSFGRQPSHLPLKLIFLSNSSITPEEDSFGRKPDHPNYKAPFSDENMEEESWALTHMAESDAYKKATGLNFYDLLKEERLIFVELSEAEKQEFYAKKLQEAGR